MKIRYAKPSELNFILRGIKEICTFEESSVWIEKFAYFGNLMRSNSSPKVRKAIQKKNILIAILEKKPVGFLWFSISKKCPYGINYGEYSKKYLWIDFSFVSKKFRKHGIGTALYNESFKIAKRKKICTVVLDVFEINKLSMKFHKKLGFEPKIHLLFKES